MKPQAPVLIRLNSAQRAQIREASGKDVLELRVEPTTLSGAGWLYAGGDKKSWLLKHADPAAYSAARRAHRPRIDPRYVSFRLTIGKSPIHRFGVFTEESIPARRNVIEYVGENVNLVEAYRRTKHEQRTYLFKLDEFWRVDGAIGGSGAEFINHSCDPNLCWRTRDGKIFCQSIRRIAAGEELTLDYHFSPRAPKVRCFCRSVNCRGTINVPKMKGKRLRRVRRSVADKKLR